MNTDTTTYASPSSGQRGGHRTEAGVGGGRIRPVRRRCSGCARAEAVPVGEAVFGPAGDRADAGAAGQELVQEERPGHKQPVPAGQRRRGSVRNTGMVDKSMGISCNIDSHIALHMLDM